MNEQTREAPNTKEDLFTIGTTVGQVARALRITAEDTTDRYREYDIEQNMGVLYLLAERLDKVVEDLDTLDAYRAKNHGYIG